MTATLKNPAFNQRSMGLLFHLVGIMAPEYPARTRTEFPLLCGCMSCGGIRDFYLGNPEHEPDEIKALTREQRRDVAFQVALIQHGELITKAGAMNYMNKYIMPRTCTCVCAHQWEEQFPAPAGRCMHTYRCTTCGETRTVDSSD